MTEPFDEYGDRLRGALHAEADAVTPSPEGLERIRSKINKRRERRLGPWFAVPWMRPLAAVAAAIFVTVIAVSATPALKNFVQTGHFSPDSQSGSGQTSANNGHSQGQWSPGGGQPPLPSVSPSPNTIRPSNTGTHVVTAPCPPGEGTVTPTGSPSPAAQAGGPAPKVTCEASTGTSSAPTTPGGPETTPPTSPTQPSSTDEPPGSSASQPAANASP
jgi:hypothetical protein